LALIEYDFIKDQRICSKRYALCLTLWCWWKENFKRGKSSM